MYHLPLNTLFAKKIMLLRAKKAWKAWLVLLIVTLLANKNNGVYIISPIEKLFCVPFKVIFWWDIDPNSNPNHILQA